MEGESLPSTLGQVRMWRILSRCLVPWRLLWEKVKQGRGGGKPSLGLLLLKETPG